MLTATDDSLAGTNPRLAADLALPIEELDFSVRVYNLLKRETVTADET